MHALLSHDIVTVTEDVWLATLNMAPRESDAPDVSFSGPTVAGVVHITGATVAAVTVQVSEPLADRVAASMFRLTDRPSTLDERVDAVGELANMVGGGLKGLMDGPSHLSIPAVLMGDSCQVRIPNGRTVNALSFDCEGHRFRVSVHSVSNGPRRASNHPESPAM